MMSFDKFKFLACLIGDITIQECHSRAVMYSNGSAKGLCAETDRNGILQIVP
jgi:hypothetical protein